MVLRYPGGKTRAIRLILGRLNPKKPLLSPFYGGGAIEGAFLRAGGKVYGYDIFEPLVNFWKCLRDNKDEVAGVVRDNWPISKERFYEIQNQFLDLQDDTERAALFYVLNRCSFGGTTLSGGFVNNHPRFNLNAISKLRKTHWLRSLKIEFVGFEQTLNMEPYDMQCYLDPPYYGVKGLYGVKGNLSNDFDHASLEISLRYRTNWLLSYNDCPEIRDLYKDRRIEEVSWAYGGKKGKQKELLIWG